ncbi:MAG: pyruvate, phosphate dikinase [Candidatus Goldiibacteriota bacterium]
MAKKAVKKKTAKKSSAKKKMIYFFGNGKADGDGKMKALLGGKGAGLAEMVKAGVPVPPGFTITTEVCNMYVAAGNKIPAGLETEMETQVKKLEKATGKQFNGDNPLLVSVRSGAKFSMPGMMDTVLNLGLNDQSVLKLIKQTKNERFAWDSYRRFIMMFSDVAIGISKHSFDKVMDKMKEKKGVKDDIELSAGDLMELTDQYKEIYKKETGFDFPQEPMEQLKLARNAVFDSWMNDRAITYRKMNDIPHDLGTAVNVQAMVYGNMGNDSGTGVGFTRNPSTGENLFYGEYLINAQGEDVVAGVRTPKPIAALDKDMPEVYKQLRQITSKLERYYKDIQDFEFTIEKGKLYMLQTRTGKRTARAAVRIAVDMVKEKLITKEEAVMRVAPSTLDQLLHPVFDPKAELQIIAKGLPASPGAATGKAVFTAEEAVEWASRGEATILVRLETCPDDIAGMDAAKGILTARGGMTSHAAVVARGMGKCCVAGCEDIKVDEHGKVFSTLDGSVIIKEGDWISLDGSTGRVIKGKVPTVETKLEGVFGEFMIWADAARRLKVRTNAETAKDARVAIEFGAEGIGLCRTEHMFFESDRLPYVQQMILSGTQEARKKALEALLPMQKKDFKELFEVMDGFGVTIRLLDPPLHEFLPKREDLMVEIAVKKERGEDVEEKEKLLERVEELHELNPMLGHRGCRLGITYPEITEMQSRAIFEAAAELSKEGKKLIPEVMVPLVGNVREFENQRKLIDETAKTVMSEQGVKFKYLVGTMIEIPRAAVTADEIAESAEFFSFGTNDLTQTGLGFSRDDAGRFIKVYMEEGIFEKDPFQTLDQNGIGKLMEIAVEKGRSTNPKIKLGICGEHGGDPASVEFCHRSGLDYVSCSPFRVPIARLAAAHAALKDKMEKKSAKKPAKKVSKKKKTVKKKKAAKKKK